MAEGVETAEQHALLFRKGCDEVQGYFVSYPRPIADYAEIIGLVPVKRNSAAVADDDVLMTAQERPHDGPLAVAAYDLGQYLWANAAYASSRFRSGPIP